jgi:hypothetical protein
MGRPPKKRTRTEDEGLDIQAHSGAEIWPSPEDSQQSSMDIGPGAAQFPDSDHLCPSFFWPRGLNVNSPQPQPAPDLLGYEDHNKSWRTDRLTQPNLPVPASSSPWPDYSTVSEATALPMPFPIPTTFPAMGSFPLSPSNSISSDSVVNRCPCLSYLYLCLSHMTSIASFPVNSHTLCSLYLAARTVQDVIRCEVCPKTFATGMQNITFVGTLLTVATDNWLRVWKTDPVELGMQSAPAEYVTKVLQSADPAQAWASWLRQTVRRAVIGGPMEPGAAGVCAERVDLLSIIRGLEERQRRWHQPGQHPLQTQCNPLTPSPSESSQNEEDGQEKDYLCLRIAGSAKAVIAKFNFDISDYPEGVEPVKAH